MGDGEDDDVEGVGADEGDSGCIFGEPSLFCSTRGCGVWDACGCCCKSQSRQQGITSQSVRTEIHWALVVVLWREA